MSTYQDRISALNALLPQPNKIQRGVAFLDENAPNWRGKVDINKIDMGHSQRCILGQVFGDFFDSCKRFNLTDEHAEYLGFLARNTRSSTEIAILNYTWRQALRRSLPWYKRLLVF